MKRNIIDFSRIYHSNNYGDFKIIKEVNPRKNKRYVLIEFINTKYQNEVSYTEVLKGCVKDPFYPKIFNVGYLGNAHKKGNEFLYETWLNMLSRCYNENCKAYKFYGEKGCYVCDEWHCFEKFLYDSKTLFGYNNMMKDDLSKYELDKDFKSKDAKCYSKETCVWIPKDDNNRLKIIQSNLNNDYTSEYIGVVYDHRWDCYQVQINYKNKQYYLGKYTSEIAAANVYNYYAIKLGISMTLNECAYMGIDECMKYKTTKRKLKIDKIIESMEDT